MSKFYNVHSKEYVDVSPYIGRGDDINRQVAAIIAERSSHDAKLSEARKRLNELDSAIRNFHSVRQNAFSSPEKVAEFFGGDTDRSAVFWEKLQKINGTHMMDLSSQCLSIAKDIQNASKRFRRNNISIAIVGESRQGKSTLIQRITGLDDKSVPTSAGDICTAARSRIINGGTRLARVTFFEKDEFFHDVIAPYFVHAGVIEEQDRVTINDFAYARELYARIGAHGPDVYIKKLDEYLTKQTGYESYLGEGTIELHDFDELREYMAQRDQINNAYDSCKYLAVKDVEIVTPFAHASNASNLMIFDTIGVSEPTLGVKDQMYRTISEEADFVLYVSRLSPESDKWIYAKNVELYYDMLKQLKGVPAYRWLFWVLNHEDPKRYNEKLGGLEGTFGINFDHIIDNIKAQGGADSSIYMPAGVISVDCRDTDAVGARLVGPLISHLAVNLGAIDEAMIETINRRISELEIQFNKLKPMLQDMKLPERNTASIRNRLKARAMNEMVTRLNDSLPAFLEKNCPEEQIAAWREEVRLVIQNLDDKIPNEETIKKIYSNNQYNALMTIYQAYQLARQNLDGAFNGDQFQFDDVISSVKQGLIRLFLSCSGLENMIGEINYENPELIDVLVRKLFGEYGSDCEVLKSAFERLDRFTVVQGNQLINWINGKTNCLDTNLGNGNIPHYWKELGLEKAIITMLQSLVGEIRESLSQEVEKLDSPIQQIREKSFNFVQSISNVGGEYSVAWQNVFEPYVEAMYPDEFKGIALYNGRVNAWNQSIDKLTDNQAISCISF